MDKKIVIFKDLNAWKEGHKLVLEIYRITKAFPKDELFGLTSQIRRAVVSYTSNIAEGFSRKMPKDKARFYTMALGSLTEVQSQLEIAKLIDLEYIGQNVYNEVSELSILVHKVTNGLIRSTKELKFIT